MNVRIQYHTIYPERVMSRIGTSLVRMGVGSLHAFVLSISENRISIRWTEHGAGGLAASTAYGDDPLPLRHI